MSTLQNPRFPKAAVTWLAAAMIISMGATSAHAQLMLRVPGESEGVPAYARVERPFVFHTSQWAAIVFYRDPGCVPGGFNLLDFFDFVDFTAPFACPLTISGFEIWEAAPGIAQAPRQAVSSGLAVPVWFVAWPALEAALADDVLTISELNGLSPLKGTAKTFHEVAQPFPPPDGPGGAKIPHLTITASGVLPDGRAFLYEFNNVLPGAANVLKVKITFR